MSQEKDIFDEGNIPQSNWFKFEKVGDRVSGQLVEVTEKKSNDPTFQDQRVFVLKQEDGSLINVGVAMTREYIIGRTNNLDITKFDYVVGFEFKKEIPPSKKGFKPAKSIEVYIKKTEKAVPEESVDGEDALKKF